MRGKKVSTNLVIVQRVLRWRRVWRRIRWRKLPNELFGCCGGRGEDGIRFLGVIIHRDNSSGSRCHHGGLCAATFCGTSRRRDGCCGDDVVPRRRRLHDSWLRVHSIRMILPLPQLTTDKANRNHGPVAPDHLLVLNVQPRELLRYVGRNFQAVLWRILEQVENSYSLRRKTN